MVFEAFNYCPEQIDSHSEAANSLSNYQIIEQRKVEDQAEEYGPVIYLHSEHQTPNQYDLLYQSDGVYSLGNFKKSTGLESFADLQSHVVVTINDMVEKIKDIFGLNRVQVAHVVKVSRPTLYNHLAQKEIPNSLDSYRAVYDLALKVEREVAADIRPGLKSLIVDGKTLLAHLKARPIDSDRIVEICVQIAEKLSKSSGHKSTTDNNSLRRTSNSITRAG